MSQLTYSLISALMIGTLDLLYRANMTRGAEPRVMAVGLLLSGGAVVLAFFGVPGIAGVAWSDWLLLAGSSACWSLYTYCDLVAFKKLDAVVNSLMSVLGYVLLNLAGIIFFNEFISVGQFIAVAVIVCGVGWGVQFRSIHNDSGLQLRLFATGMQVLATLIDKDLAPRIGVSLVVIVSYLGPGLMLLAFFPKSLFQFACHVRNAPKLMFPTIVMYGTIYIFVLNAITSGAMWFAMALYQLRILVSFAGAYFILHERDRMRERLMGSILIGAGVALLLLM